MKVTTILNRSHIKKNLLVFKQGLAGKTLITCLVVGISCFIGLASVFLPWWLLIATLALPVFFIFAFTVPQVSTILLVGAVAGIIPSFLLPEISVGAGKILPQDIFLVVLLGLAIFKSISRKGDGLWTEAKPFSIILLAMILCAIAAVVFGMLLYGASIKDAIGEFRDKIYWLIAFLPIAFVRNKRDLRFMTGALILLALYISFGVLVQFEFGITVLQNARVEDLATGAMKYSDINRSTAGGGIYWVVFALFLSIARVMSRKGSIFLACFIATICFSGILVSFGRGIWIATFLSSILVAYRISGVKSVLLYCLFAGVIGGVTIGSASLIKPGFYDAVADRLASTAEEGGANSSLGWRLDENGFAIKKIMNNPLLGTGLGVAYKPRLDHFAGWEQVRYIHNSYLGLWMKTGLLSVLLAGMLVFFVYREANKTLKTKIARPNFDIVVAASSAFLVPVITGVTQPEWLVPTGISYFAFMVGLVVACRNLALQKDM